MHFAFTSQQLEFRDAVRQVLANECTTADLRLAFDRPAARTARWSTLSELGVVGLCVPESLGGLGLGMTDLVLLLEASGRAALPEPLAATAALAAPLLAGLTGEPARRDLASELLSALAEGRVAAAVADSLHVDAPVAGADGADLFVWTTPPGSATPEVHLVGADRVEVTPVPSLDPTRRLATLAWDRGPETLVADGRGAELAIGRLHDRAAVATAAELVGLSDRMIAIAADYARQRHQFGKPIGSFQAVKHLLAGAAVTLEFARPVVYAAAWSLEHDRPDASRSASLAKAYASDAATEAARVSLQVHGAIGYTWECDLHLFLKRAWALAEAWGSADEHRARVLDLLVAD